MGRREPLDRICAIIRNGSSHAAFIMAGPGVGKSALADAVADRLDGEVTVVRVHGSAALSSVPFGVLTPYTGDLSAEESVSQVAVLRSIWRYFEELRADGSAPVLLVLDDAHHLDDASAAVVADLIAAGWASVVAAARPRPGLPQPMSQLWFDGLAERVDLRPLDRPQVEEVLGRILDGTVPDATVDAIWNGTGGNPRILDALLHDAAEAGTLARRNGIWILVGPLPADGPRLSAVVAKDQLRRPPEEQEALRLIALAGPVSRKAIEETNGASVVRSLLDQQLIVETQAVPAELSLWNDLYARALRNTVSVSRSLQLFEKTTAGGDTAGLQGEGRLRQTEWALDSGVAVPEPDLVAAAKDAVDRYSNRSAATLAARVHSPALAPVAHAIQARALYNEGAYPGAAALLDSCADSLAGHPQGPAAVLLRACAHQAAGHAPAQPGSTPEAGAIDGAGWREVLPLLLQLGDKAEPHALEDAMELLRALPYPGPGYAAVIAVGDALLAQTLAAAGRAVDGLEAALTAAAGLPGLQDSLFFFPEFILGRLAASYVALGDWEAAEQEISSYAASHAAGAATFKGSLQILRGYSMLRQGRMERAYQLLLPAVEALRLNDPLLLFRLGSALGFYAAARLGDAAQAKRLEQDFKDATAGGPAYDLLASGYAAAGAEYLGRDGKGLASLHTLATAAEASGRTGTFLELLAVCWDLGDSSVIPQVQAVAGRVQGGWAEALHTLAADWDRAGGDSLMETAAALEGTGFLNLAREAYARASTVLDAEGERRRSRQAVAQRERCDHELGERFREGRFIAAAPSVHLTRREQDIVELAVQGLTDREIAQRLMVSVRTVEGHLYRTYVKLGVRSREELESALPN